MLTAQIGLDYSMSFLDTRELSDEELLKDSIEAPSRFELLMLRYQKEFLNRATAVVKNRDEAEDVVQETFVRIYRFAPKFDSANGTFRSWSLTILMNVARTKYQKVAKERGHAVVLEDEHYQSLKDPVDSHQDFVNKDEVKSVLSLVDAETAQLLTLAYIDDLPYREIAAMMDTTEGAVKARVHRARGALRDALAKRGV
ncbi:MAG: hypothetical protein RLZZ283_183 [Candidatus Parcubacteria bacterium]